MYSPWKIRCTFLLAVRICIAAIKMKLYREGYIEVRKEIYRSVEVHRIQFEVCYGLTSSFHYHFHQIADKYLCFKTEIVEMLPSTSVPFIPCLSMCNHFVIYIFFTEHKASDYNSYLWAKYFFPFLPLIVWNLPLFAITCLHSLSKSRKNGGNLR